MPFLDVSDVVCDPMLADTFSVLRRVETVNDHGEVGISSTQHDNVVGVITMAGPNDLDRLDDSQRMGRVISCVTKFRLRGPSPGFQPDVIVWQGSNFVIAALDLYNRFGAGFMQAIAVSMTLVDGPALPQPPLRGQDDYSNADNSGLI